MKARDHALLLRKELKEIRDRYMEIDPTNKTQSGPHFYGISLEEVHGTVETRHPK